MHRCLFLIPLLLSSAACSRAEPNAPVTGGQASAQAAAQGQKAMASATASAGNTSAPAATRIHKVETGDDARWEFTYSWPAAVAAYPALVQALQAKADALEAKSRKNWQESVADAPADCHGCRQASASNEWQVVANLPGYLSLSDDVSAYTGGAHGNYGRVSAVWDVQANELLAGKDFFTSPAALDTALSPVLCNALNAQRRQKRGPDYRMEPGSNYGFDSCTSVADAAVFIGSGNGRTFDRLTVYYGPYAAGSYAEGAYTIDLPVTQAVLGVVTPEYRAAFSAK